jgi:hypothetical protein
VHQLAGVVLLLPFFKENEEASFPHSETALRNRRGLTLRNLKEKQGEENAV